MATMITIRYSRRGWAGCMMKFRNPLPKAGSESTYVCDYCNYDSGGVVLRVGGSYGQSQNNGASCLNGNNAASSANAGIGCRLQKLP